MKIIHSHLIIFFLTFLSSLLSCSNDSRNFIINGSTDLKDEEKIYRIVYTEDNKTITLDSASVKKGEFYFKGDASLTDLNFLLIKNLNYSIPFIVEEGKIRVKVYKDSLNKYIVKGTLSNNDLNEYNKQTKNLSNSYNNISSEIGQASSLGDNLLVSDLQEQARDLQNKFFNFQNKFMSLHKDSYISSLILEGILVSKSLPIDSVKVIFSNFSKRIKDSKSGENIKKIINSPVNPTDIGQIAPNFKGPTPSGKIVSLFELKGKITIIDFWASWCRPCRIENPNLVRLYRRMHEKGLEIVGVSLDKNIDSWKKGISDDGLIWNHVSNLKFWQDPIAKLYNITSIPAAFVIDAEGKIIAKNLRGAQLDAKIEELLK